MSKILSRKACDSGRHTVNSTIGSHGSNYIITGRETRCLDATPEKQGKSGTTGGLRTSSHLFPAEWPERRPSKHPHAPFIGPNKGSVSMQDFSGVGRRKYIGGGGVGCITRCVISHANDIYYTTSRTNLQ